MAIVPVTKVGRVGVVQDYPPHQLPPEAWSRLVNWRPVGNRLERFLGDSSTLSGPTVDPTFIMYWDDLTTVWWVYASPTKVYRTDGSTDEEITRSAGDYSGTASTNWSGCVLGGVPVLNVASGFDYPQMWDGTSRLQNLTNWPTNTYCKVIRAFRQYLIALNVKEGGVEYPTKIKWSTPADPGTVPSSWVPSASNLAGDYSFSESQGEVIDGLAMGDFFVVYKADSTWLMRLTSSGFVFSTTQAFKSLGILAQDCVLEFEKKHFVVTRGDVIVHDGVTPVSVIDELNREALFEEIDADYLHKVRAVPNYARSEAWIMIPVVGSEGKLRKAYVWSWKNKTWTTRELDDVSCGAVGLALRTGSTQFNNMNFTFDSWTWAFDADLVSRAQMSLVLGKPGADRKFLLVDKTFQFDTEDFSAVAERTGLAIAGLDRDGKVIVSPETVKFVREVYLRVDGTEGAEVKVQFGYQMHFAEAVTWLPEQTFTIGTSRKLDCTMSFVYFAIRITADSPKAVRIDGFDLDMELVGRY